MLKRQSLEIYSIFMKFRMNLNISVLYPLTRLGKDKRDSTLDEH